MALVKKAAKLERRSMNSYVVLTAVEASKARIAAEKKLPSSILSEEASA